ncbi:MAG: hypothetical protein IJJ56_07810 [Prevotella sp.]|nr:hypothetical protein [Prevotella sp.]
MMKKTYTIMAAALLTAGALLTTACSSEDAAIENATPTVGSETIQFTATLAPKDGTTTRAITPETDANNKEILNVAWTAGEQVAVYYQKSDDSYAITTATVGTPNADGSAPITATLTSPKDGGTVKFVYPATLHNGTGDIDASILRNNQVGTLADISANFDAATGSGTISTAAGTAVVSDKVTLTNRVCICKFHFSYKYSYGGALTLTAFHGLVIQTPDGAYTVNATTTGDIYVAMLPCAGADITFLADASFSDGITGGRSLFTAFPTGVTLAAGKFYRSLPIALTYGTGTLTVKNLSTGSITAADGDIIISNSGVATANTITIPDGATVTLAGVNIEATESPGIICNGSANIILLGTNSVKTTNAKYAGIQIGGSGTTLTISGSGSLTVTGSSQGAGIGCNSCWNAGPIARGNIVITGGNITANGGFYGAGIGSGYSTSCGDITISGGNVTANGGQFGAGIGSGGSTPGDISSCGNITITNGVTRVTATKGAAASVLVSIGMGGTTGTDNSTCGTITIGGTQYYDGTNFVNGGDTYLINSPFIYEP